MRFVRFPRNSKREHTTRQLASAKRAMERQKQSWGLFSEIVPPQDASPEDRLARIDDEFERWWLRLRCSIAGDWLKARSILRSLPAERRARLLAEWQCSRCPGDAAYLLDFLRMRHPELFEAGRDAG